MASPRSDHHPILGLAILFEGGMFVVAVGLGALLGKPALGEFTMTIQSFAWGAAAAFPPLIVVWACLDSSWAPFQNLARTFDERVVPLFRNSTTLEMGVIALLAGVGEEALFRGVFHIALRDATSVVVAVVVVSIVFGLLHFVSLTYAVMATLIGAYLAGLLIVFDNLFVPMTTHAVYDFIGLVVLIKHRPRTPSGVG